jgi:SAM-dependent methyltransferase
MTELRYNGRDLEILANMPNYYGWIIELLAPFVAGHVIEYGAGLGSVSERLAPLSERLTLVESSENLIDILYSRFDGHPKIEIVSDTLEAHATRLSPNTANTVVMVNVLEHIRDDQEALSQVIRILKPQGHLLIFVPALHMLMSKLDLVHGHFRRYHKKELISKVTAAGANPVSCRYFDMVGVLPWLLLMKLLRITTFNARMIYFNDRRVVPVSKILERIPPPFGKNLIMVATKS